MYPSTKLVSQPLRYWVQFERGLAFVVDSFILSSPGIVADQILKVDEKPFLMVALIIFLPYFIYLEYRYGQTLGKKLFGIKVFMENGKPITLKSSIIRNVFRIVDGSLIMLAFMYLTQKKQRLGDLIARSVVIKMY